VSSGVPRPDDAVDLKKLKLLKIGKSYVFCTDNLQELTNSTVTYPHSTSSLVSRLHSTPVHSTPKLGRQYLYL